MRNRTLAAMDRKDKLHAVAVASIVRIPPPAIS